MDKKLSEHFKAESMFYSTIGEDEIISFESFYEHLSKWAISQDVLEYEDFAKNEDEAAREEELEAFKKMTDRIL